MLYRTGSVIRTSFVAPKATSKRLGYMTERFGHCSDFAIDIARQEDLVDDLFELLALLKVQVNENAIQSAPHVNAAGPGSHIEWGRASGMKWKRQSSQGYECTDINE